VLNGSSVARGIHCGRFFRGEAADVHDNRVSDPESAFSPEQQVGTRMPIPRISILFIAEFLVFGW